ncbi:HigB toxin protein [Caballeronia glathei]|uniref:Plasmid maintenance system killer protein n=1 Tax=Caballeronia glathei TaxID=60547 RepID=A0A069PSL6_9BURK|nr:type II toxin-antitoxin system RelE/ParE family toxin [Caballeronia glathei]KDR43580.1 Plasmid maintenance system killer protein [Caballeronia glathei]CDY75293.1 HigB toxin protein [Caballeronia glathei]
MIQSFACAETKALCETGSSRRFANILATAERKLTLLDAAATLGALRVPPGNRLETLRGDLAKSYSIRINDQWRICFSWTPDGPADVRIIDYH